MKVVKHTFTFSCKLFETVTACKVHVRAEEQVQFIFGCVSCAAESESGQQPLETPCCLCFVPEKWTYLCLRVQMHCSVDVAVGALQSYKVCCGLQSTLQHLHGRGTLLYQATHTHAKPTTGGEAPETLSARCPTGCGEGVCERKWAA